MRSKVKKNTSNNEIKSHIWAKINYYEKNNYEKKIQIWDEMSKLWDKKLKLCHKCKKVKKNIRYKVINMTRFWDNWPKR